jgi:transposase-like protein
MVRHSLNFVGWKQQKAVAADLRMIYAAATEEETQRRLTESNGLQVPSRHRFSANGATKFILIRRIIRVA